MVISGRSVHLTTLFSWTSLTDDDDDDDDDDDADDDIVKQVYALPDLKVVKLFPCLTQPSIKFLQLIKTNLLKNHDFSCFETLRCCIYYAYKC